MKRVVPEVHVFTTGQLPIDKFNISFAPGFVRKCIARVTEEARQVVVMPLAFFVGLSGFSFGALYQLDTEVCHWCVGNSRLCLYFVVIAADHG